MQVSVGKMQKKALSPPNILIFGPVGAGKSSFIRSLLEVVENDSEAGGSVTTGKGEGSVTKTLNAYALKTSEEAPVMCTLWDAAGIEVRFLSPADTTKQLELETLDWGRAIKAANIKID